VGFVLGAQRDAGLVDLDQAGQRSGPLDAYGFCVWMVAAFGALPHPANRRIIRLGAGERRPPGLQ
jgi:hypothetical protein